MTDVLAETTVVALIAVLPVGIGEAPFDPREFGPLVEVYRRDKLPSARTLVVLPSVFAGASAVWPDRALCDTPEVPSERESADAGVPYRDRILVAAAATTIPLFGFCRNLVVFLLE